MNNTLNQSDVIVVGAGVVGIATALAAHRQGKSVTIIDRYSNPTGASIRNFGMIWPVGQPEGPLLDCALRSREIWLDLAQKAGFYCEQSGSTHLAYHDDELQVLQELVESDQGKRSLEILDPKDTLRNAPGANPKNLIGSMYSPFELNVESSTAMRSIWNWLEKTEGIQLVTNTSVSSVVQGAVHTSCKLTFEADQIYICTGHDCKSNYPDILSSSAFKLCKLQMLRTVPQPQDWKLGTHIAGGWTLRHYASFENCPSLQALKERVSSNQPEFDQYGIHIMLSQHSNGELIIGDSHTYGEEITPFNNQHIDDLILEHAKMLVQAPTWDISHRWSGTYLKRTDSNPLLVHSPEPGITLFNALGGAGMTLSMGVAEHVVSNHFALWDLQSQQLIQTV